MSKTQIAPAIDNFVGDLAQRVALKQSIGSSIPDTYELSLVKKLSAITDGIYSKTDELKEGETYEAKFTTDSSMFHVNEAKNGKGELTVKDGKMTIHISLVSDKIVNLYVGKAADAEKDKANWLKPTKDEVTYSDGTTETVNGFDVPVEALDKDFDLAILGEKGTWYDHVVSVTL